MHQEIDVIIVVKGEKTGEVVKDKVIITNILAMVITGIKMEVVEIIMNINNEEGAINVGAERVIMNKNLIMKEE